MALLENAYLYCGWERLLPSPPAGDLIAKHLPLSAGGEGGLILRRRTILNETRISWVKLFSAEY